MQCGPKSRPCRPGFLEWLACATHNYFAFEGLHAPARLFASGRASRDYSALLRQFEEPLTFLSSIFCDTETFNHRLAIS